MPDSQSTALTPPDDNSQILHVLTHGTMSEAQGMLRYSSNSVLLVGVEFESIRLLAVYKSRRGERTLWDFPDGTLCQRETAAFHMSAALGWHLVPPTVLREGLRGIGSVQYYIPHDPNESFFTLDRSYLDVLREMAVFDCIINNTDRKGGHCLVGPNGRLWGIDHGISFHTAIKLRTVIWDFAGQPIPKRLLEDVERVYCLLDDPSQPLRETLDGLLARTEISALVGRMRRLLHLRTYPQKGPGPNEPWPPF